MDPVVSRAYSVLTVKSVNEDQRIIRGTATTPTPDRMSDIVEPLGVKFSNPLPLLAGHDPDAPVGTATFDKPTPAGITFTAQIATIDTPGSLQDRCDTAWGEVKAGLVRGVSIGFRALEYSFMENGGVRFDESEVLELSLVTIPANTDSTINQIRSIDTAQRAASGRTLAFDKSPPPRVKGTPKTPVATAKEAKAVPKTTLEQISALEATRMAKQARINEILDTSAETGETLDAAAIEEHDTLAAEVKSCDADLVRWRARAKSNEAAAVEVKGTDLKTGSEARTAVAQVKAPPLKKGVAFTRYAMALASSRGNIMQASEIAKRWEDTTPEVGMVLRAAVTAGTTTDPAWASPLVFYQTMVDEFIEFLRPLTIIGRIPGLRMVPFNIRVPAQQSPSTASWVGEGAPKPISALTFSTVYLLYTKVAAIVVLTDELVRFSNPSAEAIVQKDMADTVAQYLDQAFIDPTRAANASVNPASITYGVTPTIASGTDIPSLRSDLRTLMASFLAVNLSLTSAVWIMSQQMAVSISLMLNPLGQQEFPGVTVTGGTLLGIPVVASESVPATGGSPTDGSMIILVKANEIMMADDGTVTLDSSREASLQMDSAPDSPATASTTMVSLWQQNMVGLRAERYINWVKRRPAAVQFIANAKYTG